ncbi:oxidoreductase [Diaporthe sp. PMI_573]|nr:oxidoreductase [Diaporthaceae sp. PMI_573]
MDLGDVQGKVILVTGGTAGLGARSVVAFAQGYPAHIYFTGRNEKAAERVIQEATQSGSNDTQITFLQCDQASLASVKAAATRIATEQTRLDILMANAGVMNKPPGLTADGYEVQFGTNHLAHALFIKTLMPLMEKTSNRTKAKTVQHPAPLPGPNNADARIVLLTSTGLRGAPSGGVRFDELRTPQNMLVMGGMVRYGQSKLANLLYARELARRHPSVTSVSVTPGIVATDLVSSQSATHRAAIWVSAMLMQGSLPPPEEAVQTQLWCATAPRGGIRNGGFYEPPGCLSGVSTKYTDDETLARRLWEWTDRELEKWL